LRLDGEGLNVNKTCFCSWQNSCGNQFMKKIFLVLGLGFLFACHGNETANTKPTDLDRTKNNDTSVVPSDSTKIHKDSTDTTHHIP